jgi:hypothetical protein
MPRSLSRSHTSRAIPPEALGIESMRLGPGAGTAHHPPLQIGLRSVRRDAAGLAQNIKLLAQDSKPGVGCLLNLVCRLLPAGFGCATCTAVLPAFQNGRAVAACAAPKPPFDTAMFRDSTMCTKPGRTSGRLRTTQAFIALSSISESSSVPRTISIVKIGKYEIRMFNGPPIWPGGTRASWLELFDHNAQLSVDSCSCREIDEALTGFDELVSQAERLNEACGPEEDDAQA